MTITERASETVPAVWVGCLAAYNEGDLYGEWVNVPDSVEELREEISRILKGSPANQPGYPCEEWALMDNEGFGPFEVGEYEDLESVVKYAEVITRCHEDAFLFWDSSGCDFNKMDADEIVEAFYNSYRGHWDRPEYFAMEDMENCHEIPDWITGYIDYEAYWRDLTYDGYYAVYGDGGYYIFRNED